jgi:uncharacterized membrane protein (Fun14 family)
LIGYALKKVLKILSIVIGLFLAGLTYLQSQEIAKINWDKLQAASQGAISMLANTTMHISNSVIGHDHGTTMAIVTNFDIPLTGSMATGFAIGFWKADDDNSMFNFLKKHRPQDVYEMPEPEQVLKLSLRERALKVFSKIEGLDDIKEMMLRALESSERAHTLITGPPASAKSLFMSQIENLK